MEQIERHFNPGGGTERERRCKKQKEEEEWKGHETQKVETEEMDEVSIEDAKNHHEKTDNSEDDDIATEPDCGLAGSEAFAYLDTPLKCMEQQPEWWYCHTKYSDIDKVVK